MDTRLRKCKPFLAWLSFLVGLTLLGSCVWATWVGLVYTGGEWRNLRALVADYKSSRPFREQTALYFGLLMATTQSPEDDSGDPYLYFDGRLQGLGIMVPFGRVIQSPAPTRDISLQDYTNILLDTEGDNIRYYAANEAGDLIMENMFGNLAEDAQGGSPETLTNGGQDGITAHDGLPELPPGYDYYWYFDGKEVSVFDRGAFVDTARLDSGYRGLIPTDPKLPGEPSLQDEEGSLETSRVFLAVKDVLVPNPYADSPYYLEARRLHIGGLVFAGVCTLGLALFSVGLVFRRDRQAFSKQIAAKLRTVRLEAKAIVGLLVLILVGGLSYTVSLTVGRTSWLVDIPSAAVAFAVLTITAFWGYITLLDLRHNRMHFFTHNLYSFAVDRYRDYERKHPWQKKMLLRSYILAGLVVFVLGLSILAQFSLRIGYGRRRSAFFGLVIFTLLGITLYSLYRYLRVYRMTVGDIGAMVDHIGAVKGGDIETRLILPQDSDMHEAALNLNSIQEGMSLAVNERVKSERMKVDLVTNVSHDLKTPLTSMVSYVELLAKEEGLPPHVGDYVSVLAQKTKRLQNLIQDLFELAKATSDTIVLDMERLDLKRLVQQALADMDERIQASGLGFRVSLADRSISIVSDGKKLHRVLQNLISNALKYSLPGSRVFVELAVRDPEAALSEAVLTIKNTANYEMNFDQDEVLQRFSRGDRSRSTEGSGLGLSIAKGFTEVCGGRFRIMIDGDQFKVELRFQMQTDGQEPGQISLSDTSAR